MTTQKEQNKPLQAEEYIKKMMKKRRLLTGVELGNCLLCRIGYDIQDPTDEFILNTLNHWTSQADFDAYYLRLEIRSFLMLLHNSAVYAQAKGHAESQNIVQVIMQIVKDKMFYNSFKQVEIATQAPVYKTVLKQADQEFKKYTAVHEEMLTLTDLIASRLKDGRENLRDDINHLITSLAKDTIKEFTETLTFILNCDETVNLIAQHFDLDLHTYKTKKDRTARLWLGVNMLDNEGISDIVNESFNEKIIDKETHDKAINTIKQASSIDTKEPSKKEIEEVKQALKELKTQADFIHIREWLIKTMIKTARFI